MYNEKHPQADGSNFEVHSKFFWTPFWSNSIPEWVDKIDKACQVHLDWAHERESSKVEKLGSDFGMVYHSGPIETDPNLKELVDYIGGTAYNLLETWGNDISNHKVIFDRIELGTYMIAAALVGKRLKFDKINVKININNIFLILSI